MRNPQQPTNDSYLLLLDLDSEVLRFSKQTKEEAYNTLGFHLGSIGFTKESENLYRISGGVTYGDLLSILNLLREYFPWLRSLTHTVKVIRSSEIVNPTPYLT